MILTDEQMNDMYERWTGEDAPQRPWAHEWRTKVPLISGRLCGCVVEGFRVVEGAWDRYGSHELELRLRASDGRELLLYFSVSALGDAGPRQGWDEEWVQKQADWGTSIQLTLFADDIEFDDVEDINVPSQEAWFEDD